jgi:hypothetical protein
MNTNYSKQPRRHHNWGSEEDFDFEFRRPTVKRIERSKPKHRNQIIKEYYLADEEDQESTIH